MRNLLILFNLILLSQFSFGQNALHFDGSDDAINCGTDTAFNVGDSSFTLEAWINASSWKTNIYEGTIINKEDNNTNGGYMLRAGSGGKVGFAIGAGTNGSWTEINTSSSLLSLNTWHHLAATYDGSKLRLYVDGVIKDSASVSMSVGISTTIPLGIGFHPTYGRYWNGAIDEVRIWNTVRTPAQISSKKDAEFCSQISGLRAYYKFDHGSAGNNNSTITSVSDFSGLANHASLSNFALSGSSSNWITGKNLNQDTVITNDTIRNCGGFYYTPHQKYYAASTSYSQSLNSHFGCDSTSNVEIIIKANTYATIEPQVCDSFVSPAGTVYKKSGTYYDKISNSQGCDSVITVVLKVGVDTFFIDSSDCKSYTSHISNRTYTISGKYYDTLNSSLGCDSIIAVNLNIIKTSYGSTNVELCDSSLSPSGNFWMLPNAVYKDTIVSSLGCDSILSVSTTGLTTYDTVSKQTCTSYTTPSGKVYSKSGIYNDTIPNNKGCIRVFTITLNVDFATSKTITLEGCRSVSTSDGRYTFTETGTYKDTLVNVNGCDSFLTIKAKVNHININASFKEGRLRAESSTGSFQWLDCKKDYETITDANTQVYKPLYNTRYAVEITDKNCQDTSNCINVQLLGVSNLSKNKTIIIYPNPTNKTLFVQDRVGHSKVVIYSQAGQIVLSRLLTSENNYSIDVSKLAEGIYFVYITKTDHTTKVLKIAVH